MAELTLRPDGPDVTLDNILVTGTATAWQAIDEDPDSNDGDTTRIDRDDNTTDATAVVNLTATPADFVSMDSLTARVALRQAGLRVDDTLTLSAQMLTADSLPLSDEVEVATHTFLSLSYEIVEVTLTGLVAGSKVDWDRARLRLRWDYTQAGLSDSIDIRVSAVELDGTYIPRDVGSTHPVFTRIPTPKLPVRGTATSRLPALHSDTSKPHVRFAATSIVNIVSSAQMAGVHGTATGQAASQLHTTSQAAATRATATVQTHLTTQPAVGTVRRIHTARSRAALDVEDELLLVDLL